MNQARALLSLGTFGLLTACANTEPAHSDGADTPAYEPCVAVAEAPEPADETPEETAAQRAARHADAGVATVPPVPAAPMPTPAPAAMASTPSLPVAPGNPTHAKPQPDPPAALAPSAPSIGIGNMTQPAGGPAPTEAKARSGEPFVLVKNWDFGSAGTIRTPSDLQAEFQFHDQFGTIANGTNYGAVTVAPNEETAITALNLNLPDDRQPVEDPTRPTREWTTDSLLLHARPLTAKLKKVSVKKHNVGNGSFTAKWQLPNGGELLGHDVLWETRVRMPKPVAGYWLALWTAGAKWDGGAEMDVMESFGAPHIPADAFHADSVGGVNNVDYASWYTALTQTGVPDSSRALADWHTWTWIYLRDDTYSVLYDGHEVQHGEIHWTSGGTRLGEPIDMRFLFDFSWGHMQVKDVNIELPAEAFPLTYEIDYSRVYMR
ncbi:MAG: hypothetical protein RL701_3405 [Pseudomonadota bacterium]